MPDLFFVLVHWNVYVDPSLVLFCLLVLHSPSRSPAMGQAQNPVKTSGVTDAAPIYPLDVVVDESGSAWVVDLNLPGVWKYQSGEVTKAIEGSKKFRQKLNKVRCLAISPSGQLYW